MAEITELTWDSDFFGFKTGRISWETTEINLRATLLEAVRRGFRLIYLETENNSRIPDAILKEFHGRLADRKVIFSKELHTIPNVMPESNITVAAISHAPTLYPLAIQSGHWSRFKTDPMMPQGKFEEMYHIWIDKSLSGHMADVVFVSQHGNSAPEGFMTIYIKDDTGHIGLIAVDEASRNHGTGRLLIMNAEIFCLHRHIRMLEVATQKQNVGACEFYRKCGFQEKTTTDIYHFWL